MDAQEQKQEGRDVVLWSGGLDSTVIVHELLQNASIENPLYTISVDGFPQIDQNLLKLQKKARKKYIDRFNVDDRIEQATFNIEIFANPHKHYIPYSGLPQPTIWMSNLIHLVHDNDTIHLGYIKGDDFWYYRKDFEEAFHLLLKIKDITGVKIEYPFRTTSKYEVLELAKKYEIPKSCYWYCENPRDGKPCGRCDCCVAHKSAKMTLKYLNKMWEKAGDELALEIEEPKLKGS